MKSILSSKTIRFEGEVETVDNDIFEIPGISDDRAFEDSLPIAYVEEYLADDFEAVIVERYKLVNGKLERWTTTWSKDHSDLTATMDHVEEENGPYYFIETYDTSEEYEEMKKQVKESEGDQS